MLHSLFSLLDLVLVAVVLVGFHYRRTLAPATRTAWYVVLGAIIVVHSELLAVAMHGNVVALREWDFVGFWINAHVAAAGQNFYEPAHGQALAQRFAVSDSFRREILDVGFWYPAPSIFVFLPLAAFADPHRALVFWYGLQIAALLAAIVVLARTFLRSDGVTGVGVVAALILLLPSTAQTVFYAQTTFIALFFTALFWNARRSAAGGVWLVFGTFTKPFVGALALVLLCRRHWRPFGGAAGGAIGLSVLTAVAFGASTFVTYFRARPDSRIPVWVYGEATNASLLGLIVRGTHGASGNHLSHVAVAAFAAVALVLTATTLWLCLRREETSDHVALALTLSLALLIYPTSQTFYSVLLIAPALVLWARRPAESPPWAIVLGICCAYALTMTGFPVFATLLSWVTFALLAAPQGVRIAVARAGSNAVRPLLKLAAREQPARSTALALGIIGIAIMLGIGLQSALRPQHSFFGSIGTDFRAFYCSGAAANTKASPYRVEPLRSCEHRVQPASGWSDELVVPSPLPGYDIAFFGMVARLPYSVAKALWLAISVASLLGSVFFLTRLTRLPALLLLLGLSLTDAYQSIIYEQLPPVVVFALCAAAYFLQRRRYTAAAVAVGASMIEPHLGLPAFLAMFVWCERTRRPLVAVAAALGAAALVGVGAAGNADYLVHVLPQHAAAELVATDQYALSHVLHVVGLADRAALAIGSASYALMLVAGIMLARRVARTLAQDAPIVLVPPAATLIGGAFIHGLQFAAALPAAFLLLSSAGTVRSRRYALLAVALLVVPWDVVVPSGLRVGPGVVVSLITLVWLALTAADVVSVRLRFALAGVTVLAFCAVLGFIHQLPGPKGPLVDNPVLPSAVLAANADASENWAAYLRSQSQPSVPAYRQEFGKIPYWLAIAVLLAATAGRGRQRDGRRSSDVATDVALRSSHGY